MVRFDQLGDLVHAQVAVPVVVDDVEQIVHFTFKLLLKLRAEAAHPMLKGQLKTLHEGTQLIDAHSLIVV